MHSVVKTNETINYPANPAFKSLILTQSLSKALLSWKKLRLEVEFRQGEKEKKGKEKTEKKRNNSS